MQDGTLAFLYSPAIEGLAYPADCPFKTQRASLTRQRLLSFGLLGVERRTEVCARKASRADLEAYHYPEYLDQLERAATEHALRAGRYGHITAVLAAIGFRFEAFGQQQRLHLAFVRGH